MERVLVFCGSSPGRRAEYHEGATELGRILAARELEVVYGGASVGLMGAVADGALAAGGAVIGVIPSRLVEHEIAHAGLTKLHVVETMHERKALMADLADAFLALPGGFGTWDEFCEALTWSQLGLQRKACAFLNIEGYYDPLLTMVQRAAQEGFIRAEHRELLLVDTDPGRILERLQNYEVPYVPKWVDREER